MGSFLGGGDGEAKPWKAQRPYIGEAFEGAQDLYNQGPSQYYPGQTVAGSNPALNQYYRNTSGGSQAGYGAGQGMMQQGQGLAGGLDTSAGFYSDAMNNYFNPYASAEYQSILDQSLDNPTLQANIEASQADIYRNVNENLMPQLNASAVGTGNMGSSRTGIAEGIIGRGAMEQASDVDTQMRGASYNRGLDSANQWANMAPQYQMQAAGNLANLGQFGSGQVGQGYDLMSGANQDAFQSGQYQQGREDMQMGSEFDRYMYNQQAPWENLNRYNQIVSGSYGGGQGGGGGMGGQLLGSATQLGAAAIMGMGGD